VISKTNTVTVITTPTQKFVSQSSDFLAQLACHHTPLIAVLSMALANSAFSPLWDVTCQYMVTVILLSLALCVGTGSHSNVKVSTRQMDQTRLHRISN